MRRRDLLKASGLQACLGLTGLGAVTPATGGMPADVQVRAGYPQATNLNLRDYLSREARRITDRSGEACRDAEAVRKSQKQKRRQYLEMMGLGNLPPYEDRPPLNVTITGTIDRPGYRIEKLYFESVPKLYVTANLYLPKNLKSRAPGVLYVCGHGPKQKFVYQAHPRRWAELGFVSLLIETIEGGEVEGTHRGCTQMGWYDWYSRGYTPAGIEMLNGIRGLDLLVQRPEVDGTRLGVTGISGGGAYSWWIAAADERIQAAAPVCGSCTLASYVGDRIIDGNCDCIWFINTRLWDLADVGALIAPRPLLIASQQQDDTFAIDGVRELYAQLKTLYTGFNVPEQVRLVEPLGGHGYRESSRTEIFSWFLKYLQGKEIPPTAVGDLDESPEKQESEQTLRVYLHGSPPGNRILTIQDDFIAVAKPPKIESRAELAVERSRVLVALRDTTFRAFPAAFPRSEVRIHTDWEGGRKHYGLMAGRRFSFNSEEGWRLFGRLIWPKSIPAPVPTVIILRSPGEEKSESERYAQSLWTEAPWATAIVEPRGTGETEWGQGMQWNLRRAAAWTGRTIASMQVYDVLCAMRAVRSMPLVDGKALGLAARGEMAAVALYAALLDGNVNILFLESPPPTQNAASQPNGRGAAIEMLSCLRVTDLPQVSGLLYPTEQMFLGEIPSTYQWAEDVYRALGPPGRIRRFDQVKDWRHAV